VPPYLSYKTFYGFIERLKRGVPNRIDRSVMPSLSGSTQSQLVAALRYLDLITPTSAPTKRLIGLVSPKGTDYENALRELLVSSYPLFFDGQELKRMTAQEIKKGFAASGASGDTVRKCAAFFLAAARHAQISLPPFIAPTRSKRRAEAARRKSPSTVLAPAGTQNHTGGTAAMLLNKFPDFDPTWPAEIKSKWLDAFGKILARVNGEEDIP
jgi:hypothetical protein